MERTTPVKGFKNFLMRGNLIDMAVAFIMGTAFATVVKSFTTIILDLLGKLGGTPNFSGWVPGGIHVGAFTRTPSPSSWSLPCCTSASSSRSRSPMSTASPASCPRRRPRLPAARTCGLQALQCLACGPPQRLLSSAGRRGQTVHDPTAP